jgi:hypothetical protein
MGRALGGKQAIKHVPWFGPGGRGGLEGVCPVRGVVLPWREALGYRLQSIVTGHEYMMSRRGIDVKNCHSVPFSAFRSEPNLNHSSLKTLNEAEKLSR